MSNEEAPALSDPQRRFIDEVSGILGPWGMQPTVAKVFAYLLLRPEPVALDAIAADLDMAKSSASVAARALEQYGLARRHGERGSKRVRFGASDSYSGYIMAQAALMGDLGRLIEARAASVAQDGALRRLRYFASFHRKMEAAIVGRIRELTDEYAQFGPDEDLR